MKFDFNEANILNQNFYSDKDTKDVLIHRLTGLLESTEDPILRQSVFSLISKIEHLSEPQVKQIQKDIANKKLIATMNLEYGIS